MTKYFEVPFVPSKLQKLKVSLSGVIYTLVARWNSVSNCWILDIYDSSGTVGILRGIPLITGADLLEQYQYLEIGGHLIALTIAAGLPADQVPQFNNLGTDAHLYYVVT